MPAFPFSFSNLAKVSPDVVKFLRFVIDGGRINFVNELTSICEEFYYSRGLSSGVYFQEIRNTLRDK